KEKALHRFPVSLRAAFLTRTKNSSPSVNTWNTARFRRREAPCWIDYISRDLLDSDRLSVRRQLPKGGSSVRGLGVLFRSGSRLVHGDRDQNGPRRVPPIALVSA